MLESYAEVRELFKVRKPKVLEGGSDATIGENPAEEVNTSKAYIDVNHKDGALLWLMLTGMLSARRCARASKERRLGRNV